MLDFDRYSMDDDDKGSLNTTMYFYGCRSWDDRSELNIPILLGDHAMKDETWVWAIALDENDKTVDVIADPSLGSYTVVHDGKTQETGKHPFFARTGRYIGMWVFSDDPAAEPPSVIRIKAVLSSTVSVDSIYRATAMVFNEGLFGLLMCVADRVPGTLDGISDMIREPDGSTEEA